MSVYQVQQLKPSLILVCWLDSPEQDSEIERQFVETLQTLLDTSEQVLYFISDLRCGRITNRAILAELSALTQHPNWGGSSAFSHDPISLIHAGVFAKFAEQINDKNRIFQHYEDAIAFLERLEPGISDEIDWQVALSAPMNIE